MNNTEDVKLSSLERSGSARVWIVEMMNENETWHPTVGCRLTKADGRKELADWKQRNPCDKFRLTCYSPNAEVSEGGTRGSRIETAAQSRPSLH